MTEEPTRRLAVVFIFVTVFLDMVGIGLIFPVLPNIVQVIGGMNLAEATLVSGWLFFAYTGMQILFGPLMGSLSDTYGRRPLLLLSVFGLAVDYLLTAFAPTLLWLFVGRVFAGICGASYTTANAYLADITEPEDRARVFGYVGAAVGLGFIIGPAIGGFLGQFGPRVPFFVAAFISILNFTYGYFILPESLPVETRRPFSLARSNPFGTFKVFLSYRRVLPLCAVLFLYYTAISIYPAIWAFWGIARYQWSEFTIGLTLAFFGLLMAITAGFLTGPTVKRLGESRTVILGLTVAVIADVCFAYAPGTIAVLLITLINAPEGMADPALTALMSKEAPANAQGELQGGIASAKNVAMLVGTPLFAQIFGMFLMEGTPAQASQASFLTAAIICAAALLVFLWQRRHRRHPPQTGTSEIER
jgi:MFS transporter, DHA1 family, tetracycline resistance protein